VPLPAIPRVPDKNTEYQSPLVGPPVVVKVERVQVAPDVVE